MRQLFETSRSYIEFYIHPKRPADRPHGRIRKKEEERGKRQAFGILGSHGVLVQEPLAGISL
jgi:hypothetical protein